MMERWLRAGCRINAINGRRSRAHVPYDAFPPPLSITKIPPLNSASRRVPHAHPHQDITLAQFSPLRLLTNFCRINRGKIIIS